VGRLQGGCRLAALGKSPWQGRAPRRGCRAEQRKRIARRIKELQPEASQRKIADVLGVDESTVRADMDKRPAGNPAPALESPPETAPIAEPSAGNPAPPPADLSGADAALLVAKNAAKHVRGTFGTGENEWYTPASYIEMARRIKELQPEASQRKIAGVLGATEATVARDLGKSRGAATNVAPQSSEAPETALIDDTHATYVAPSPADLSGADAALLVAKKTSATATLTARHGPHQSRGSPGVQ
jgi:predicted transcriptional regulator